MRPVRISPFRPRGTAAYHRAIVTPTHLDGAPRAPRVPAATPRRGRRRTATLAAVALLAALAPRAALAAGPDPAAQARKGVQLAQRGDCPSAVPILEESELARHTPAAAFALAGCYLSVGELMRAAELFHTVALEQPLKTWTRADRDAVAKAPERAAEVDARIPSLRFDTAEEYPDLEIDVDGHQVENLAKPLKVAPDVGHTIRAQARDYKEHTQKIVVGEGEKKVVKIKLEREGPPDAEGEGEGKPSGPAPEQRKWLGVRYRGYVVPKFVMNWFADGGKTLAVPGAALSFQTPVARDLDVVVSLNWASYGMGPTPFKGKGTPDTEYELVESSLQSLGATVDLLWSFPMDDAKKWAFRLGGGVGIGVAFGNLTRNQAYPATKDAVSDPYSWTKCVGPSNPTQYFRYCNGLDKDKDHYGDYSEPSWFSGGKKPALYPWASLPELGLSYRPSPGFAMDLEVGLTLSGIMTGLGMRFGL